RIDPAARAAVDSTRSCVYDLSKAGRSILPWLADHRPRFARPPRPWNETEKLSHRRDESSKHSCIWAWRGTEKCVLVVDRIYLLPGLGSLCSVVYQPHKE